MRINHIGGVMIIMLSFSVVDCGFGCWSPVVGQTKDYKIGICYFSAKHKALRSKNQRLVGSGIRIMCPSGLTCLPTNCCFSELVL